jgi:hypothetical protein
MALTGEVPYQIYRALFSAGVQLCENPHQPVPDEMQAECVVQLLAGPIAHAKFQGRKFEQIWDSWVCMSDNDALEDFGVKLTGELVEAAKVIIKDNWKAVDSLAKVLIKNEGRLYQDDLHYWLSEVKPAKCDALLKRLAKTTKAKREADMAAKSFVRVWDDDFGESLTFIIEPDEELCEGEWLLHFVWDDVGEEEEVAALLEAATGIKVDLKDPRHEDRFEEHAKDIIRAFFEQSSRYRILKHSPDLEWLRPSKKEAQVAAE